MSFFEDMILKTLGIILKISELTQEQIQTKHVISDECLLAHLSRRLIGELIVYEGVRPSSIRRPSVNILNDISSEAVRPILLIFHI